MGFSRSLSLCLFVLGLVSLGDSAEQKENVPQAVSWAGVHVAKESDKRGLIQHKLPHGLKEKLLAEHGHASKHDSAKQLHLKHNAGKIVGGDTSERHKYEWIVALKWDTSYGSHYCGGTLIAPDLVLTAAHCVGYASVVEIGRFDLSDATEFEAEGNARNGLSALTCEDLSWNADMYGDETVGGESICDPKKKRNWQGSMNECESAGGRLCTVEELQNDEAKDTGCGSNKKKVWTSTPCEDDDAVSGCGRLVAFFAERNV